MTKLTYDPARRSYAFTFTVNNWRVEDYNKLKAMDCKYMVMGREEAPSTGTPHLQGYIAYKSQKSWGCMVKKFLPEASPHIEPAMGTAKHSLDYCSKQDPGFFEKGTLPADPVEKGERGKAKIKQMWELAKAGKFEELPPNQIKTYEYIHAKYGPPVVDRSVLDNIWIWGASGVGKSRWVRDNHPVFYAKNRTKWWDGYNREPVCVLDDLDPSDEWMAGNIKIWSDHYVFNAEVKGGMLRICPPTFIITSQFPPERIFTGEGGDEHIAAIRRRFRVVELVASQAELVARDAAPQPVDTGAVYADGFIPGPVALE